MCIRILVNCHILQLRWKQFILALNITPWSGYIGIFLWISKRVSLFLIFWHPIRTWVFEPLFSILHQRPGVYNWCCYSNSRSPIYQIRLWKFNIAITTLSFRHLVRPFVHDSSPSLLLVRKVPWQCYNVRSLTYQASRFPKQLGTTSLHQVPMCRIYNPYIYPFWRQTFNKMYLSYPYIRVFCILPHMFTIISRSIAYKKHSFVQCQSQTWRSKVNYKKEHIFPKLYCLHV